MKKNDTQKTKSKNKNLHPLAIALLVLMSLYALSFLYCLFFGVSTAFKSYGFLWTQDYWLGLPNISHDKEVASQLPGTTYSFFGNFTAIIASFNRQTRTSVSYFSIFGAVDHPRVMLNIGNFLLNTLVYSVICPMLTVIISAVSGFLCAKYKYKYSGFLCAMLLIVMTIPTVGTQSSTITLLQQLGIYDTYFSMIIMNMHFGGIYFFVFVGFFKGMSDSFIEAAEIDGASQLRILTRIVFPLASKTMLTVFIILFVRLWNDYETPVIYYPNLPTLSYGIWQLTWSTDVAELEKAGIDAYVANGAPLRMAGIVFLSLPMLILFICFRNVIMGNLTLGGVKE